MNCSSNFSVLCARFVFRFGLTNLNEELVNQEPNVNTN